VRLRKRKPAVAAAPDDPRAARLAALKLLNRRDYGARELAERLAQRGFDRPAADAAVAGLVQERLVAYHANRGRGPLGIAYKLREAGVSREEIAAAIDAESTEWRVRCAEVRRRRFGARLPTTWIERGRQARFLSQRGFNAEQIRAAVGQFPGED